MQKGVNFKLGSSTSRFQHSGTSFQKILYRTQYNNKNIACHMLIPEYFEASHLPWHYQAQGNMAVRECRLESVCGGRAASHCCVSPEPSLQVKHQSDCVLFLSKNTCLFKQGRSLIHFHTAYFQYKKKN